jgi:proteasome assembly chaperone (PAC2) family protein
MPSVDVSEVKSPVPALVAGWPGMGRVGLGAAEYLRRSLRGSLCARIDVAPYYMPEEIAVADGLGRMPEPPAQLLYFVPEPPLLVFEGDTQLAGQAGVNVANELLDLAVRFKVETVYTGAAYAMPVSFRNPVQVYGVATNEELRSHFEGLGVEALSEGRITGLNGLLLGLAAARGIPAACFLATMPQYAIETPNPRASKALVKVFERILNTSVDMSALSATIKETDRLLSEFENRVTAAIRALKEGVEQGHEARDRADDEESEDTERPEPQQLMQRIESMFEEAQRDRSKANPLKEELDRWGLFSLYEDRFLDLFNRSSSTPD